MREPDGGDGARTAGVQVIARAAEILRLLQTRPEGASLAEIARLLGLPRSTVHRIVAALRSERLVVGGPPAGRVRLGPGLMELAAAVAVDVRQHVHGLLQGLSDEVGETVDLAVLDGDAVLFVDQVSASQRLQAVSAIGARFPLHCSANGKAILAALPPGRADEILPRRLPALTAHTITDRRRLRAELRRIRESRIAFDREEHTVGICAVGSAIRTGGREPAAVTIPLPSARFGGNENRLAAALLRTCDTIERRLAAVVAARSW